MFIDANLIFGGLFMLQNGLLQQCLTGTTTFIVGTKRRFEARSPTRFSHDHASIFAIIGPFGRSESTQSLVLGSVRSLGYWRVGAF